MAQLDVLIRKRSGMKAKLTNFSNYISSITASGIVSELQHELKCRLEKYEALYDQFDELQVDIEVCSDKPDDEYDERNKFEERYYALMAQARSLLSRASAADANRSVTGTICKQEGESLQHNFIRLPKIDLPRFHGSYQYWLEYRDTFLSLIHNSDSIDDISKFHYLRASLSGAALEIITNIDFKGDNYLMAWQLLCNRYDNSRLLVHNHVHALFNVETVSKESSLCLRRLLDTINKNIRALKTLNEPTQYWDTLVVYIMSNKLDVVTSRNWEEYRNGLSSPPSLQQFCEFISNKADLLETIENKQNINSNKIISKNNSYIIASNIDNSRSLVQSKNNNNISSFYLSCPLCSKNHLLFTCDQFRSLTIDERLKKAKELKVCFNCLRLGHGTKRCRLTHCKYCNSKHNTLLHAEESKPTSFQDPMPSSSSVALPINHSSSSVACAKENNIVLSSKVQHTTSSIVLLSTAMVKVVDDNGQRMDARLLLDNGSTANFITQSLCNKLNLSTRSVSSEINGINNQSLTSTQCCNLTIESNRGTYKANIECYILPEITKILPSNLIDVSQLSIPADLQLADPSFSIPSVIDILVGAEVFWDVISTKSISLGKNKPKLFNSKLGWIVTGQFPIKPTSSYAHFCNLSISDLDNNLRRFWELDSVSSSHSLSSEEKACEESFKLNTIRNENGQFIVTIPLKNDTDVLGESYDMAKRRFLSIERRFQRDPVFKERYIAFMQEYERLGHMTENITRSNSESSNVDYFLPHHGVINDASTTTKFRVVFDASAPTSSGLSFNDIQMVGPTIQDDLLSILLRFRQHKYVISADIEKMYRAINVTPNQRSLQQIIFREDPKLPLKTYTLNTVTYGTASAPYLATKCLSSLASNDLNEQVKMSILHDFYVDDYLSGGDTISQVVQLSKAVNSILSSAKFYLRKWKSNSPEVLSRVLGVSSCESSLNFAENQSTPHKTLGLFWLCNSDYLSFSVNINFSKEVTKRIMLSVISQIFDPLGLVGPCVVEGKILLQSLWLTKTDWDDQVPDKIKTLWTSFSTSLSHLNDLKIPRWVLSNNACSYELHIFTDASELAYGSCVYVRSIDAKNEVKVRLLISKNRVAPIKSKTVPRLELCGALLGTRLYVKVINALRLPIIRCYFWCDSTIVLNWLFSPSNLVDPFVRNRVHEIQESTADHTWRYVASKDNPADLVSRGVKANQIRECTLWWSGPEFLLKPENEWPKMPSTESTYHYNESQNSHPVELIQPSGFQSLINKLSNFNRLIRVMSYIQRFVYNLKNKFNKRIGLPTKDELDEAFTRVIRTAQIEMFPEEYLLLQKGKLLPRKSKLASLSPFMDSDGVIRVGGRLENSPYEYNIKHPILLCSKHHVTKILFRKYHIDLLHAGPQLLLANIRQLYWPLGGRNLSRVSVRNCLRCFRYKNTIVQPIMGQLPISRTNLEFPFLHCSVDYAGPVLIADKKGRGCKLIKSYVCIFVCLAVKAVHIELVTDLTKEGYMSALNRFVARRGKPQSILSDNATNFVGVFNELQQFLNTSNLPSEVAQQGIQFSFTPPYSPHFNGLAEAAVRSTKHHLKRLIQMTHFTYEELSTCLTQIEAVLNSRPLTPLSPDPTDLSALTPSHFLIGRPLLSVPYPQVTNIKIEQLRRYDRINHIKQHFWKRFSNEYVSLLQTKTKWFHSTGQLKIGTLVLLKEAGQPPLLWPLARVTKIFPGVDGDSRVAELKMRGKTVRRSYKNICPLPMD